MGEQLPEHKQPAEQGKSPFQQRSFSELMKDPAFKKGLELAMSSSMRIYKPGHRQAIRELVPDWKQRVAAFVLLFAFLLLLVVIATDVTPGVCK